MLEVATYNVHQWIGRDGRRDPDRVVKVIHELQSDIIALQEVTLPLGQNDDVDGDLLEKRTGRRTVLGPTFFRGNQSFGNVILTSRPILKVRRIDLSVTAREPRGALDVLVGIDGVPVRIIAAHLGLRSQERSFQIGRLLEAASLETEVLTVIMGDFNAWFPGSAVLRKIKRLFGPSPRIGTYPARFPILPLDRIWARPAARLVDVQAHRSPLAGQASDHLPLKTKIVMI